VVKRGEVWWYEDETVPRRPVLVLTRNAVASRLTHVVGVPATTVVRGIPSEVSIGTEDGMPRECVLSADNVGQFRRSLMTDLVATLDPVVLRRVCDALAVATECEAAPG
jgi:mRNA interferase MazF